MGPFVPVQFSEPCFVHICRPSVTGPVLKFSVRGLFRGSRPATRAVRHFEAIRVSLVEDR